MEHSYRIRFQAWLRQQVYSITNTPYSNGEKETKKPVPYPTAMNKIIDDDVDYLRALALDWSYDAKPVNTALVEKRVNEDLGAAVAKLAKEKGLTPEQLMNLLNP